MRLGFDSSLTDFRFEMVYFVCVEHLKHSLFLSHARTHAHTELRAPSSVHYRHESDRSCHL